MRGATRRLFNRIAERALGPATAADGRPQRQIGAIPYVRVGRHVVFLLVTSRGTGRWVFPKGSLIDGLSSPDVAAREAYEEAGVEGRVEPEPVGRFASIKVRGLSRQPIEVEMFALEVGRQLDDWPERNQRRRHWATLDEARRLLADRAQIRLAETLAARLEETPAEPVSAPPATP